MSRGSSLSTSCPWGAPSITWESVLLVRPGQLGLGKVNQRELTQDCLDHITCLVFEQQGLEPGHTQRHDSVSCCLLLRSGRIRASTDGISTSAAGPSSEPNSKNTPQPWPREERGATEAGVSACLSWTSRVEKVETVVGRQLKREDEEALAELLSSDQG